MTGGLCSQLEVNTDIDTVGPLGVCGKGGTGESGGALRKREITPTGKIRKVPEEAAFEKFWEEAQEKTSE